MEICKLVDGNGRTIWRMVTFDTDVNQRNDIVNISVDDFTQGCDQRRFQTA